MSKKYDVLLPKILLIKLGKEMHGKLLKIYLAHINVSSFQIFTSWTFGPTKFVSS